MHDDERKWELGARFFKYYAESKGKPQDVRLREVDELFTDEERELLEAHLRELMAEAGRKREMN